MSRKNNQEDYGKIFSCAGKTCLVTGGSGLLGKGIAKALYDFGASVYVADIQTRPNRDGMPESIRFVHCNIASMRSVTACLQKVILKEKKIDVLINCAYPRTNDWTKKIETLSCNSWEKNVNAHLGGYFFCCRNVAEEMKKRKSGSIINMASIYGIVAPDFGIYKGTRMTMPAAYAAIKGGIISFSRYMASYYASCGIRVNTVSPGGVFNNQPQIFVERYEQRTPLKRMAQPDDIVGAVVYLASDASRYVTGINLVVDGGLTAW